MANIYDGSFVLGNTSATQISAGPGIKLDTSVPGVIGISNDETVLWSGDLTTQAATAALSESVTNFERIKVYGHSDDGIKYGWSYELETYGEAQHNQIGASMSNNGWSKWFVFSLNDNVLTNVCGKVITWGTSTWMDVNFSWGITKIVGINRVSGGN